MRSIQIYQANRVNQNEWSLEVDGIRFPRTVDILMTTKSEFAPVYADTTQFGDTIQRQVRMSESLVSCEHTANIRIWYDRFEQLGPRHYRIDGIELLADSVHQLRPGLLELKQRALNLSIIGAPSRFDWVVEIQPD